MKKRSLSGVEGSLSTETFAHFDFAQQQPGTKNHCAREAISFAVPEVPKRALLMSKS